MKGLKGKAVIVTGSGSGIGRAIAERLAAEGCIVGVFDLNAAAADATVSTISAAGGKAHAHGVDIADLGPAHPVEARFGMDLFAFDRWDVLLLVIGIAVAVRAIGIAAHNEQFTTFVGRRKRQIGTVEGGNVSPPAYARRPSGGFQLRGAVRWRSAP